MYEKRRKNRRFNNIYKRINSETARNLNSGRVAVGPLSLPIYWTGLLLWDTRVPCSAQYVGGIIMTDIACPPSPFYRPRSVFDRRARQTP